MSQDGRFLSFDIPKPLKAKGLLVVFASWRFGKHELGLGGREATFRGNVGILDLEDVPLEAGEALEIKIATRSSLVDGQEREVVLEAPVIVRAAWIDAAPDKRPAKFVLSEWEMAQPQVTEAWINSSIGRLLERSLGRTSVPVDYITDGEQAAYEERYSITPAKALELRTRAVRDAALANQFFLEVEGATNSKYLDGDDRKGIEELEVVILVRYLNRAHAAIKDCRPQSAPIPAGAAGRKGLELVSSAYTRIARRVLDLDRDAERFSYAFEMFATDRCALPFRASEEDEVLAHMGVPNGLNFFKFAELALLCIQSDVPERAFWVGVFPHLVRATHLFVEHAGEPDDKEKQPGSALAMKYDRARVYCPQMRQVLREAYAKLESADEATQLENFEEALGFLHRDAFSEFWSPLEYPSELKLEPRNRVPVTWAKPRSG